MKVMYRKDAEPYVPAGHYDVKCIRLHDQNTSGSEHLIVGVSYFCPMEEEPNIKRFRRTPI